jgi:hypothetical protein
MRSGVGRALFLMALTGAAIACGGSPRGSMEGSAPEATPASAARTSSGADPCTLVTAEDATALFGQPAVRQAGSGIPVPFMAGECLWTWDTETANQLLQFRIWSTVQGYARPQDQFTEDMDIGDRGYIRAHPQGGVDVEWVQGERMVGLSYSKVGSAVPSPTTKVDAMKDLARKVSGRL